MANGYFTNGFKDTIGYFDMFFRKVPDGGGFAIMAGVEQLVNYLSELSFTQEDIDYLRSKHIFREEFLDYLKNFKFTCDVWAVPEGTPIFPGEPIVTVRGPVIQAQFVETMVLLSINHQSLIATKTNRIVRAADGRAVMEFGSRRAQAVSYTHLDVYKRQRPQRRLACMLRQSANLPKWTTAVWCSRLKRLMRSAPSAAVPMKDSSSRMKSS